MAHMHERHDSSPLQQVLWKETDHRHCDLGEVWLPWTDSAIVHYPDETEQWYGGERLVRTVNAVVEGLVFAGLSSW